MSNSFTTVSLSVGKLNRGFALRLAMMAVTESLKVRPGLSSQFISGCRNFQPPGGYLSREINMLATFIQREFIASQKNVLTRKRLRTKVFS